MDKLLNFKRWLETLGVNPNISQPPDPAEEKLKVAQRSAIVASGVKGKQGAVDAAHAVVKSQASNQALDPKKLLKYVPDEPATGMDGGVKKMKKK